MVKIYLFIYLFGFLRQGISVALKPALELAFVNQVGLKLTEICLPLPPECWDERLVPLLHYCLAKIYYYYVYNAPPACMPAGKKKAPDLITNSCEPLHITHGGCWELNSAHLQDQSVLLTSEPSLLFLFSC